MTTPIDRTTNRGIDFSPCSVGNVQAVWSPEEILEQRDLHDVPTAELFCSGSSVLRNLLYALPSEFTQEASEHGQSLFVTVVSGHLNVDDRLEIPEPQDGDFLFTHVSSSFYGVMDVQLTNSVSSIEGREGDLIWLPEHTQIMTEPAKNIGSTLLLAISRH